MLSVLPSIESREGAARPSPEHHSTPIG